MTRSSLTSSISILLLAFWSDPVAAQITACGSARGLTPYVMDSGCRPMLTFHVSGQCLSACREVTQEFTSPDATALGACFVFYGTCLPAFIEKDVYDPFTREYSSTAVHRVTTNCQNGPPVRATSGACPCAGCSGPVGPGNNTTPGEDPLIISVTDTVYQLTSLQSGVKFDLNADGEVETTAWTAPGSDDAFLVLDRNFNGTIDDGLEIFGDETPQVPSPEPNGFRALAVFDDPMSGGNADGRIDREDGIYGSLMLWTDRNHDGRSQGSELQALEAIVSAIDLAYQRSHAEDEFGNELRYWANLDRPPGHRGGIVATNVFFVVE